MPLGVKAWLFPFKVVYAQRPSLAHYWDKAGLEWVPIYRLSATNHLVVVRSTTDRATRGLGLGCEIGNTVAFPVLLILIVMRAVAPDHLGSRFSSLGSCLHDSQRPIAPYWG